MKKQHFLTFCFIATTLVVGCGPSNTQTAEAEDAAQTENVEREEAKNEETSLADSPSELADFAVECFRTFQRDKLLPYATDAYGKSLKRELAQEEKMKGSKGFEASKKQMAAITYTRSNVQDMGSSNKLVRYKSNPKKYDMKVLLEQKDGKWHIDQVGPDM